MRILADERLDWSRITESVKKERIEKCLEYIRRITKKRQLVIIVSCDIVITSFYATLFFVTVLVAATDILLHSVAFILLKFRFDILVALSLFFPGCLPFPSLLVHANTLYERRYLYSLMRRMNESSNDVYIRPK